MHMSAGCCPIRQLDLQHDTGTDCSCKVVLKLGNAGGSEHDDARHSERSRCVDNGRDARLSPR